MKNTKKNNGIWSVLFLLIAVASILAVAAQNREFSFSALLHTIKSASVGWLCTAVVSMAAYILLEGAAIVTICKAFGHGRGLKDGFIYSSADIYFSAITPSATGGQPASAYFMLQDGIPGAVATAALLLNLMMYTMSLIVLGMIGILISPKVLRLFHPLSIGLILLGCLLQLGLALLFYLLLYKESLLHRLCRWVLSVLARLHLIRKPEEKQAALTRSMEEYRMCVDMLQGKGRLLLKIFSLNLFQRASQIAVTVCTFLSIGGIPQQAATIWSMQSFVVIGAYCIPIPGSMGVTDYLMLDGFTSMMRPDQATHLELLSRTLSFYCCILLCGMAVLLKYYLLQRRKRSHDRFL